MSIERDGTTDAYLKNGYVFDAWYATIGVYLLDDYCAAKDWAKRTIEYADDYFFGAWRDEVPSGNNHREPPSRIWHDLHSSWVMPLQSALVAASALGLWERAERFATYPREGIRENDGISAACDSFWLYFCAVLRGASQETVAKHSTAVLEQGNKSDRLLLAFADAVRGADNKALQKAADEYFKHYKRVEAKKQYISSKLAMDGSMVLHWARHLGRTVVVPNEVRDHIFEL